MHRWHLDLKTLNRLELTLHWNHWLSQWQCLKLHTFKTYHHYSLDWNLFIHCDFKFSYNTEYFLLKSVNENKQINTQCSRIHYKIMCIYLTSDNLRATSSKPSWRYSTVALYTKSSQNTRTTYNNFYLFIRKSVKQDTKQLVRVHLTENSPGFHPMWQVYGRSCND